MIIIIRIQITNNNDNNDTNDNNKKNKNCQRRPL